MNEAELALDRYVLYLLAKEACRKDPTAKEFLSSLLALGDGIG